MNMINEESKLLFNKLRKNFSFLTGFYILLFFIIISIFAPLLAPIKIPTDNDLEEIKISIEKSESKLIILRNFINYYNEQYKFIINNSKNMKLLKDQIGLYRADNNNESGLILNIKCLCENYIIDKSYYTNWQKDKKRIVADLKKEIKRFEKKENEAYKINIIIDNFYLNDSENYLKKADLIYRKLLRNYKKGLDFDPYIIPAVTWNLSPAGPTLKHPFGITNGKDIYYGIIWGCRTSFKTGFIVVFLSTLIGIIIGSIAAYYGGIVDNIIMRIVDVFLSIPYMLCAIFFSTILGTGLDKVIIAMIAFGWMITARLIRGNILQIKNENYVSAAKAIGVPDLKIIIIHILPNSIFPVIISASMRIGSVVIIAAAMSFLGIGAPSGYADWGSILSYSRDWILTSSTNPFKYWYLVFFPGLAMFLFVLSWNLIGDALRDIFDPKFRL